MSFNAEKMKTLVIVGLVLMLVLSMATVLRIFSVTKDQESKKQYIVEYVPREVIYPAYGYNGSGRALVREDLPLRVKNFVTAHELYHLQDTATWGGWLGREFRANIVPGSKDPIGLAATIIKTITDSDRIGFYLNRLKEGY